MKNRGGNKAKSFISSSVNTIFRGGEEYKTTLSERRTPFPFFIVICAVMTTVLIMFIVLSFVQVAETNRAVSEMKKEIEELSDRQEALSGQLNAKYNFNRIESVSDGLGLNGKQKTTVYFESGSQGDISYVEEADGQISDGAPFFSAIYRGFRKIIEFLD